MIEALVLGFLATSAAVGSLALGAPLLMLARHLSVRHRARDRLRRRAERLGLTSCGEDLWSVPLRGRDAVLGLSRDPRDPDPTQHPCLYLPVPTARLRLRRHRDPEELHTIGDPDLDGWLVAGGSIEDRAVLTGEVRAALAAVRTWCSVSIFGGRLWFYVVSGGPGLERLEDAIASAARIVAALERVPVDPVERLARMAAHDPIALLRASALARLGAACAEHPSAREVARRALADREPQVRLEAAIVLHERSRLVRVAVDDAAPASLRGRAARALERPTVQPTLGEIAALLAADDPEVRRAGVRLARGRGADAEELLIAQLSTDEPLVAGVVQALGDLGGVPALAPLRELHAASSSLGGLRGLVEAAIARIRTRAEDRIGGLALAAGVGGELAVAGAGGELATVTPQSTDEARAPRTGRRSGR